MDQLEKNVYIYTYVLLGATIGMKENTCPAHLPRIYIIFLLK